MIFRRALARLGYEFTALLIDLAMLIAILGHSARLSPHSLSSRLNSFGSGTVGDWHSVPLSEFLDMLTIPLGSTLGPSDQIRMEFILASPATLLLFLVGLLFFAIGRLLYKAKMRQRTRFHSFRQKVLIDDLERKLEGEERQIVLCLCAMAAIETTRVQC